MTASSTVLSERVARCSRFLPAQQTPAQGRHEQFAAPSKGSGRIEGRGGRQGRGLLVEKGERS